jgi:divinyl chlorophyllide a 8-vinyl-reductase
MDDVRPAASEKRVFLLGGSGTIGRATVRALVEQRHDVVCFVRDARDVPDGATARIGDVTDPASLARDGLCGEHFDVLVSCLASRTGAPRDAWAIDYRTHVDALAVAKAAGVTHMVLLSAICVQKPLLAFQHAKLAFERALIESGLTYSIVRPTAFFKSLSGQVDRVRLGKPFLVFGDGYIAACIDDTTRHNKILPVGGPGAAITPRQQGEYLFALLGMTPRFRHVPVAMLDVIIAILSAVGRVVPAVAAKAELARIGRYYATESMLVLNAETGGYDADSTPAFGSDTLFDYYERLVKGEAVVERGDHAVF